MKFFFSQDSVMFRLSLGDEILSATDLKTLVIVLVGPNMWKFPNFLLTGEKSQSNWDDFVLLFHGWKLSGSSREFLPGSFQVPKNGGTHR